MISCVTGLAGENAYR